MAYSQAFSLISSELPSEAGVLSNELTGSNPINNLISSVKFVAAVS